MTSDLPVPEARRSKLPGPDHPISIEPYAPQVLVSVGERIIGDTRAALMLREASYPPVYYLPRNDVDLVTLDRSATRTWCPYKGEAHYFRLGEVDIAWSYETPFAAVADIAGMLAFYATCATITSTPSLSATRKVLRAAF